MFHRKPGYCIATNIDNIHCGRGSIIQIASPISVGKGHKTESLIALEKETMMTCGLEMPKTTLGRNPVGLGRAMHELSKLADSIGDAGASVRNILKGTNDL